MSNAIQQQQQPFFIPSVDMSVPMINEKIVKKFNKRLLKMYKEKNNIFDKMNMVLVEIGHLNTKLSKKNYTMTGSLKSIAEKAKEMLKEEKKNKYAFEFKQFQYERILERLTAKTEEIQHLEDTMRFENELIREAERKKEEMQVAKRGGINLAQLYKKIPDDVLRYMSEFLMYDTRIALLEHKYKFSILKLPILLNKMSNDVLSSFYTKMYYSKENAELLPLEQANKVVESRWWSVKYGKTLSYRKIEFHKMMYRFNKESPAVAHHMMKTFAVFFQNPKQNYAVNEHVLRSALKPRLQKVVSELPSLGQHQTSFTYSS
jgi:hypothetical protein